MTLADVPNGSDVLIDSNILIFSRRQSSAECAAFLSHCVNRQFLGAISILAVSEFCHRQMIYEAQSKSSLGSNPAKRLGAQPQVVKSLTSYAAEVQQLLASGLRILNIEHADFAIALQVQKTFGLLTNDSRMAAVAIRHGIRAIATADSHFDSVTCLDIYKPTDV
jgi:predicted nucleic acid-binding protein